MSQLRDRIDSGFGELGHWLYRHRWLALVVSLLPVLGLASQLPKARFDTSTEGFLHEDDPTFATYNEFRDQFGRDEMIVLALHPAKVFDLEFLETLRELHDRLENELPHIDEVTSLVNARATRGAEGELIVEDLMEDWPESEEQLAELEAFALGNPSYRNLLISEDGRFTTLAIKTDAYSSVGLEELDVVGEGFEDEPATGGGDRPYLTDAENTEVVEHLREIVAEFASDALPIYVAGSPVVTDVVKGEMKRNMLGFIRLTILAIAIFLFVLFRRFSAVLLPLVVVIFSLLATIGLMAATDRALKLPTMILPSFLLAVGVGDAVHVLTLFYRYFASGRSREDAIAGALEHSGLAVVLTSLTTAGGLLSFAPTDLAPISDLGLFAPFGIMMAMFLSLTLLPALLAIVPLREKGASVAGTDAAVGDGPLDRGIAAVGDLAAGRPWVVLGVAAILFGIALLGAARIDFSHNPLLWLPDGSPTRVATETVDRELRGTINLEILLDGSGENAWYDPALLADLSEASASLEGYEEGRLFVGRAFSLVDVLKEIHKALNENQLEFYVVPEQRDLIAQEFLLFENSGSDDLEDLTDSQFSRVRLSLKAPWIEANAYPPMVAHIEQALESAFGDRVEVTLTGLMMLLVSTITAVMISMAQSYVIAFGVIAVLMILLVGGLRLGLLAMIPNVMPVVMALGVMGWVGFPLDVFTLLIGSIALGLAVDDTIHFMHTYRREFARTGDSRVAIHVTLQTTGRAMLFTTLVLSTGFFIFMFSTLGNLYAFGLLTGFAIIVALLADFLVAPALMQLLHGNRSRESRGLR